MTMHPMTWPMPATQDDIQFAGHDLRATWDVGIAGTAAHELGAATARPASANDNSAVLDFLFPRSGGLRGGAIAPARSFAATPASPPAPAGGGWGFPRPWSPPPFTSAWLGNGGAS